MEAREVLEMALGMVDGNQAELARRLERSETTVSRWVTGRNGIDYESALRLSRITRLPAAKVLDAVGLDPTLLPVIESSDMNPIERDVVERTARVRALAEATDGFPEGFVETYIRKVLDRTEDELTSIIRMLKVARNSVVTTPAEGVVTRREQAGNSTEEDPDGGLTVRRHLSFALAGAR